MNVIYLAGPISKGDLRHNLRQFDGAHRALMHLGFAVYNPGLTCYAGASFDAEVTPSANAGRMFHSVPYEQWMATSLAIVSRCDAVIRLPGESAGADEEVAEAKRLGIPVFIGFPQFLEYLSHANNVDSRRPHSVGEVKYGKEVGA